MKVLLHGCNGRMGQVLSGIILNSDDMSVSCGVDKNPDRIINSYPVFSNLSEVNIDADVVIDFSNHTCIHDLLKFGIEKNLPLVICTTGFTPEEKGAILNASKKIPIFNSANMSLGVNLLISLVKQAASLLHEDFDIEIIEKHHNQKLDSPSGTALMIADGINSKLDNKMEYVYGRHSKTDKRSRDEIGIHAVRGGSIVGEHQVIFAGSGEVLEINHSALSRDVFAYGALKAARFMSGREAGLYNMNDLIG